jgi:hypothetical protein
MKRVRFTFFALLIAVTCFGGTVVAENFPTGPSAVKQYQAPRGKVQQQKLFYGYVPPPPIRHTWPGGYRAIINEMTNTLMEHILGFY